MQNEDYTSIKYLMKELDPAEAVKFEQRMMQDEELLREVECMRRTLRQLEKLPVKQPPSELTEYIVRRACSRNCSSKWRRWWEQSDRSVAKYYAAAALIVIGMGLGLLSFQYTDSEQNAINVKQSVTDADRTGNSGLIEKQKSRAAITSHNINNAEIKVPHGSELDGILDTMQFQESDQSSSFLPPLRTRYQQKRGAIEFTGASR